MAIAIGDDAEGDALNEFALNPAAVVRTGSASDLIAAFRWVSKTLSFATATSGDDALDVTHDAVSDPPPIADGRDADVW